MYDPSRGMGCLVKLVQAWALIFTLQKRPEKPISDRRRLWLRIAAAAVCLVSLAIGAMMVPPTFRESDPWARFMVALFTFGVLGLPTSIVPIVIFGLLAHVRPAANGAAAVGLALAYFLQWQMLAWGIFQQSRAPRG